MPVGLFFAKMRLAPRDGRPLRYCAADDYRNLILADDGEFRFAEILGNVTIVKIRASGPTLTTINADPDFDRIPKDALDDSLADLTIAQRNAFRDKIISFGYSLAEIQAALGNDIRTHTVREVLQFCLTRWRQPILDVATGTISFESFDYPGGSGTPLSELAKVADV